MDHLEAAQPGVVRAPRCVYQQRHSSIIKLILPSRQKI
jgi:hypothetical protein